MLLPALGSHPTSIAEADGNGMDIAYQSVLDPEHVAVWHRLGGISPIKTRESHEYHHDTHYLVNDVSSVGDLDGRWEATDIACICREVSPAGICLPRVSMRHWSLE